LRELLLINESISKKLAFNDKILEEINAKLDNFSSAVKEQIMFKKKIELQIAQLASALSFATKHEQVKGISTRGGKSTRDPPYPKGTHRTPVIVQEEERNNTEEEVLPQDPELRQAFHDTTLLPFPRRNRKGQNG
jgi:LPS O-antigen subunit length determinant protein (WzzB/FepE family)